MPKVIAKLNGEWYECCMCGHKLAKRVNACVYVRRQGCLCGTAQIEIKCKHKSSGGKCNTVNVLEV